jgi:hypothetical protein
MTAEAAAMDGVNNSGRGRSDLNQRESFDAFRTERLLDNTTAFQDSHFLEVWTKLTLCRFH